MATVPTSEQTSTGFRSHVRMFVGMCKSALRGGNDVKPEDLATKENEWVSLKWKDLRVGDLVMLKEVRAAFAKGLAEGNTVLHYVL